MNRLSPIRLLLLAMGVITTGVFLAQIATGHRADDTLLVFAGSMFTTYAITETDANKRQEDQDRPPRRSKKRSRDGGDSAKNGSHQPRE